MIAYVHIVHEDVSRVVGRADMQKDVRVRLRVIVEFALIPEQSFVVEELCLLRFQSPGTWIAGDCAKSYSSSGPPGT